ncbi:GFA family protein [Bradyrhizobium diversitatis]|uniref:GFA family protein n=1 Tax=Bradyrhizobium diversitatis TaxID=2755406 RepID=UPI004063C254
MIDARCSCGAVSLSLRGPTRLVAACHCIDCQRRTGAPFGVGTFDPVETVRIDFRYAEGVRSRDRNMLGSRSAARVSSTSNRAAQQEFRSRLEHRALVPARPVFGQGRGLALDGVPVVCIGSPGARSSGG